MADLTMFNKQVNFYIMRALWQIINGRNSKGDKGYTIHESLGMSRPRYEKFINGAAVRLTDKELQRLQKQTGISISIFTGATRIKIDSLSSERSKWESLFNLYSQRYGEVDPNLKKEFSEKIKRLKKEIHKALEIEYQQEKGSNDFKIICDFIKAYSTINRDLSDIRIITKMLEAMTLKRLEQIPNIVLAKYVDQLNLQIKYLTAIGTYREYYK